MDTSKEYIKMCEKANEVQSVLSNNEGYGGKIDKNNNNEPYPTAWVYNREPQCSNCERHLKSDFCPDCGGLAQVNVSGEICKGGPCLDDIDNSIVVWLPRQDQLQGMVFKDMFTDIFHCIKIFANTDKTLWYKDITSMEQLWLAFVMKEKYNKVWNGKKWVKDDR